MARKLQTEFDYVAMIKSIMCTSWTLYKNSEQ